MIKKAPTAVSVNASPASPVLGQTETLTATVTAASPSTAVAPSSGTVTFFDGGTQVGNPQNINGSGIATITNVFTVGPHSITAVYNGDGVTYAVSPASPTFSYSVGQATPRIVVTDSPPSSVSGGTVSFTASITAQSPGVGTPTGGTVTFYDGAFPGGTQIGNPVNVVNGTASISTNTLPTGTQTITAVYSGNANFGSGQGTTSYTVFQNNTVPNQTMSYLQPSLNINMAPAQGYTLRQAGTKAWFLLQDNGLFFAGGYFQNSSGVGAQEKWIKGSVNQFGNVWYYILPSGQFFAWNNHAAGLTGALLGSLDPIYYYFPSMLHDASSEYYAYAIESTLGLRVAGPNSNLYYENFNGLGERWLLSSSNVWYYLTPDGRFWTGGGTFLASLDEMYYNEPSRLVNALSASGQIVATVTQPPNPNPSVLTISQNVNGTPNKFVGQWIVELTTINIGQAFLKSTFTVTVQNSLPVLSPIANPPTLHNPGTGPNTQTVSVSVSDADSGDTVIVTATGGTQGYALQRIYNLRSAGSFYTNSGGSGEKWIKGNLNQFNNPWYFIKPDLTFWAWNGGSGANGAQLAQLDQRLYFENPAFLYQGQALDLASAMQQQLGLHVVLSQTNIYGRGEKWLQDANKAWYFILPDGTFYKWSGILNSATGTLWATFDPDYYVNVATRFATTLPQYTVQANPGNSVSITPLAGGSGPNFVGDIWVLVGATDDNANGLNRRFSYQYFKTTVVNP